MASFAFKDPPALFGVAKSPSDQTPLNEDMVLTCITTKEEPPDDDIAAAQPVRQQLPEQVVAHCAHDYDSLRKKYLLGNKVQSFVEYPGVSTGWYSGMINCHYKEDDSVGIQLRVDKKMDEKDESVLEWPVEKAVEKSRKGKHLYLRFPISEVLRDFSDEASAEDELGLVEEKVEKSSVENPSKDHKQDVHQLAAQELTRQLKIMDEKELFCFVNQRLALGATEANPAPDSLEVKTQETETAPGEEAIYATVVIKREEEPADENLSSFLPLTVANSDHVTFPIGCPVSFMRSKDAEVAAVYYEIEKTKNSEKIRYDIKLSGENILPRMCEKHLSFRRNCPVTYKCKPAQVSEVSADGSDYSIVLPDDMIEMEVPQSELKFDRHRFEVMGGCIAKAITVDLTVDQTVPMKLDTFEDFHLLDTPEDDTEGSTSHGRKFSRPSGIKRPEGEGALKCEDIPEPGNAAVVSLHAGPTKEELELNCDSPTKMSNTSSSLLRAFKTEVAARASHGLETSSSSKAAHTFPRSHAKTSLKDGKITKAIRTSKKLTTSKKAASASSAQQSGRRSYGTSLSVMSHKESGQKQLRQNRDAKQSSCKKRAREANPMTSTIPKKKKTNSTNEKGNATTLGKEKRNSGYLCDLLA